MRFPLHLSAIAACFLEAVLPGLEHVVERLSTELVHSGAEAVLLSPDQMLIRKHMVTRNSSQGFKTQAMRPAPDGYAVYLSRIKPDTGQSRPVQRISQAPPVLQWKSGAMQLRLARATLNQSWQIMTENGDRFSLTTECGSEEVFGEVDGILTLLAESLFL